LPSADESVGFGDWGESESSGDGDGEPSTSTSTDSGEPDLGAQACEPIVTGDLKISDITSPASVECVERVLGDLTVGSTTTLVDLGMLGNLREVGGDLRINGNGALTSLHGLEQLERVGLLDVRRNHKLDDLHGLDSLVSVQDIAIVDNKGLNSLVGLPIGLAPASLTIADNDSLVDLDGLPLFDPSVVNSIDIAIETNANLADLSGLSDCCGKQAVSLLLAKNPSLASLAGLEAFMRLEALRLHGNSGLVDLSGLDNLHEVGVLDVQDDHCGGAVGGQFVDFAGAPVLADVDVLQVQWVASLTSFAGLEQIESLDKLVVRNNDALPWTAVEAFSAQTNPTAEDVCGGVGGPSCMDDPCPTAAQVNAARPRARTRGRGSSTI
jgi:hypothetical protein